MTEAENQISNYYNSTIPTSSSSKYKRLFFDQKANQEKVKKQLKEEQAKTKVEEERKRRINKSIVDKAKKIKNSVSLKEDDHSSMKVTIENKTIYPKKSVSVVTSSSMMEGLDYDLSSIISGDSLVSTEEHSLLPRYLSSEDDKEHPYHPSLAIKEWNDQNDYQPISQQYHHQPVIYYHSMIENHSSQQKNRDPSSMVMKGKKLSHPTKEIILEPADERKRGCFSPNGRKSPELFTSLADNHIEKLYGLKPDLSKQAFIERMKNELDPYKVASQALSKEMVKGGKVEIQPLVLSIPVKQSTLRPSSKERGGRSSSPGEGHSLVQIEGESSFEPTSSATVDFQQTQSKEGESQDQETTDKNNSSVRRRGSGENRKFSKSSFQIIKEISAQFDVDYQEKYQSASELVLNDQQSETPMADDQSVVSVAGQQKKHSFEHLPGIVLENSLMKDDHLPSSVSMTDFNNKLTEESQITIKTPSYPSVNVPPYDLFTSSSAPSFLLHEGIAAEFVDQPERKEDAFSKPSPAAAPVKKKEKKKGSPEKKKVNAEFFKALSVAKKQEKPVKAASKGEIATTLHDSVLREVKSTDLYKFKLGDEQEQSERRNNEETRAQSSSSQLETVLSVSIPKINTTNPKTQQLSEKRKHDVNTKILVSESFPIEKPQLIHRVSSSSSSLFDEEEVGEVTLPLNDHSSIFSQSHHSPNLSITISKTTHTNSNPSSRRNSRQNSSSVLAPPVVSSPTIPFDDFATPNFEKSPTMNDSIASSSHQSFSTIAAPALTDDDEAAIEKELREMLTGGGGGGGSNKKATLGRGKSNFDDRSVMSSSSRSLGSFEEGSLLPKHLRTYNRPSSQQQQKQQNEEEDEYDDQMMMMASPKEVKLPSIDNHYLEKVNPVAFAKQFPTISSASHRHSNQKKLEMSSSMKHLPSSNSVTALITASSGPTNRFHGVRRKQAAYLPPLSLSYSTSQLPVSSSIAGDGGDISNALFLANSLPGRKTNVKSKHG
jgi:hypothetical protein